MSSKSARRRRNRRLKKEAALLSVLDRNRISRPKDMISRPARRKQNRGQLKTIRQLQSITGYGDYSPYQKAMYDAHKIKDFEGNFAADYGERLGRAFGGERGATVGEGIQSLAKVFGYGAYNAVEVKKNSLVFPDAVGVPMIVNTKKGEATVFQHKEYVMDVVTGTGTPSGFTIQSFDINPANSALFPWLSEECQGFQEWELLGCLVEFKSLASENTTSLGMGAVIMAVDYNYDDSPPNDKLEMENLEFAMSEKPACSMIMPVECAKSLDVMTHLFIPPGGTVPSGKDPKFYNLGRLHVASQGCPAASTNVGELWVSYEVALYKPTLATGGGSGDQGKFFRQNFSACAGATPWGTHGNSSNFGLPLQCDGLSGPNTVLWPQQDNDGVYLCIFEWVGTSATITAPTFSVTGCSKVFTWNGAAANESATPVNGVASTRFVYLVELSILAGQFATLSVSIGGTLPTNSNLVFKCFQLPPTG